MSDDVHARRTSTRARAAGCSTLIYVPGDGVLTITLGISFNFLNGNPADPTWVASVGGPANAATYKPEQFNWTTDEIRTSGRPTRFRR